MSIAEGIQCRVGYKEYASGAITANTLPTPATDPGVSGAQILRRVTSTINLNKESYQSAEVRTDRQIVDFRHGVGRVAGSITGELSGKTYQDLFEAAVRGTWEAPITASQSDFTSMAATLGSGSGTFTAGGGSFITKGFRVGHIIRFTNLSDADNNSKNFVILAIPTAKTLTVYPSPDTMSADTSFTMASIGRRLIIPSTGFQSRKFAFEHYYQDLDIAKFFAECRIAGFNIGLPASGLATCEFPVMGRDQDILSSTNAPFFINPAAETTTGIFAAVNGLIRVGGTTVGVVTGLTLSEVSTPASDAVVGQPFVPEIFLGRHNLTGTISAELQDGTFLSNFQNEDEISVLVYLTASNVAAPQAMTLFLPRIKFADAANPAQGEGAQLINLPFQALKSTASETTAGVAATTFQLCDTESA